MTNLSEGALLSLCNPLLDISCKVDLDFLRKYDLKANSAILGDETHMKIYDELNKDDIEYVPGGSGQNAMRAASWVLGQRNACTFMGCTGRDQNAEIMRAKAAEVGLRAVYQVTDAAPTGTCAVLITGKERSLVAHLAAANLFSVDHLDKAENWAFVERAKTIYISGFFFTVCHEAIMRVCTYAHEQDRTLCINLSAPFLSQFFTQRLLDALPYVDILFGNEDEARTFAKHALNLSTEDVSEIALAISNYKKLSARKRLVVITQGADPVVYACDGVVREIAVHKLAADKIVDTNGAGDAFVGGFLAQLALEKSVEKCIDCGIYVSSLVVQRSGCTFPDKMEYH